MSQSHQKTSKSWELTPYEIQRKPQEVIMDGREIQISPRSLHSELMCPICLDMLRQTQTTKECLHRFCSDCITTALRSGNKECPTCRKKLVSRRSLRSDPNFDALIRKIYPNREEFDTMTQNAFEKISMISNPGALSQSIEEGLKSQAKNRNQKMKKSDLRDTTRSNPASTAAPTTSTNDNSNQQSTSQQQQQEQEQTQENGETNGQTANPNSGESDKKPTSNGVDNSGEHNNSKTSRKENRDQQQTADNDHHDDDDDDDDSKEVACGSSSKQPPSDGEGMVKIDIELRPHPEQNGTKADVLVRKINVVEIATMHHVSHYLTLRIMMEKSSLNGGGGEQAGDGGGKSIDQNNPPEFTLFVKHHDAYHELCYDEKLTDVRDQRWKKKDSRVHIYYLRKPKKQQ